MKCKYYGVVLTLISFFLVGCQTQKNLVPHTYNSKSSYLFIDSPEQIDNLDTVTYFFTHSSPSSQLTEVFALFAEGIGVENGFVIISPNTDPKNAYLISKQISSCPVISSELWPTIFFEDRNNSTCYSFNYTYENQENILQLLSKIESSLNNSEGLDKDEFELNLRQDINKAIDGWPSLEATRRVLLDFASYLTKKIYE
jgi:hypothetical protein